jgi:hypothetical protein
MHIWIIVLIIWDSTTIMSSLVPVSTKQVSIFQLDRTKYAMNVKEMTETKYQLLKLKLKPQYFNRTIHQKIIHQLLKDKSYRPVESLPNYFQSKCVGFVNFPKFKHSLKKQMTIYKIGGLPIDTIRLINEYAFDKLDEVCYSLFYLSADIYSFILKNTTIKNSLSRNSSIANEVDEYWIWDDLNIQLCASNCCKCGEYKHTKTVEISPNAVCHCV